MRAICVNTSKPRMLHFFVHYLESVIVDHCTTRPCWIPILLKRHVGLALWTTLTRSWWTTSPKQRLSDVLQWMNSDCSFRMWICSLDKNKTRWTFTCSDLWVWKHLKTTRSIYGIWIFGILLVVSPSPCMSIGPRDVKQGALHCRCFLDHLRTPCRNVVRKNAFSLIQILLHSLQLVDHWYFLSAVGTWFHRAAVGHFLQDHYRWKALTCPLTLWKSILKTCCLTSFWSMCAVQDLTHLPDHPGVLVERVGHIWALSENQLRSCCIGSHPRKHTTTHHKRL